MIKKSRDDQFIINTIDDYNIEIKAIEGFNPTIYDLTMVIIDCFKPNSNEKLVTDYLKFHIISSHLDQEIEIQRGVSWVYYLDNVSKAIKI